MCIGRVPGSIAAIYDSGLAASTATAASFPIPTTLGGAVVTVNGIVAPILYASPAPINIQIPFEASAGAGTISVTVNGAAAGAVAIYSLATAPGLFTQQGNAAVVNQNGLVNSSAEPAAGGAVIAAYVTGLGATNSPVATGAAAPAFLLSMVSGQIAATIGNTPATIQFAGLAPGFAGLYQIDEHPGSSNAGRPVPVADLRQRLGEQRRSGRHFLEPRTGQRTGTET